MNQLDLYPEIRSPTTDERNIGGTLGKLRRKEMSRGTREQTHDSLLYSLPFQRPPRTKHFVGRQKELAQLKSTIKPGSMITLTGASGIGKSALASEAIWLITPQHLPPDTFPDGIIYHDFNKEPQANQALSKIARAFGEDPEQGTPATAALRALAGRRALLILDGAEQADDLEAVLAVRGGCGVLITSRQRKDAYAEQLDISALPTDDAVKLLKAWAGEWAADEMIAQRICDLVGGLPLAVRIIGRYLAQQKENAIDFLARLKKTPLTALDMGQPRDESISSQLEKSLTRVSEAAEQALAVVGMLPSAPFNRQEVAHKLKMPVHAGGRLLGELVNQSLLVRTKRLYEVSHPLIHTYAKQHLSPRFYTKDE